MKSLMFLNTEGIIELQSLCLNWVQWWKVHETNFWEGTLIWSVAGILFRDRLLPMRARIYHYIHQEMVMISILYLGSAWSLRNTPIPTIKDSSKAKNFGVIKRTETLAISATLKLKRKNLNMEKKQITSFDSSSQRVKLNDIKTSILEKLRKKK